MKPEFDNIELSTNKCEIRNRKLFRSIFIVGFHYIIYDAQSYYQIIDNYRKKIYL